MNTSGAVSFQTATPAGAPAPAVIGANNGLVLSGGFVQLGGPNNAPAPLLNARAINLAGFGLRLQRQSQVDITFQGSAASPFMDVRFLSDVSPGVPVARFVDSGHNPLVFQLVATSNIPGASAEYDCVAGFFGDEGFNLGVSFDASNFSHVRLTSKASNSLGIGTGVNGNAAPIVFVTQDVERMRIDDAGPLLISRTASASAGFRLQVGDGNSNVSALFNSGNQFSVALSRGPNNGVVWMGATAALNPDLIVSNSSGVQIARLGNDGTLEVARISTSGSAWALGDVVAGAVVPDTTRSVEVTISGVTYNLIVAA